jgi:hypothetical protein
LGTPGKFWSIAGKLEARAPAMSVHGTKLRGTAQRCPQSNETGHADDIVAPPP